VGEGAKGGGGGTNLKPLQNPQVDHGESKGRATLLGKDIVCVQTVWREELQPTLSKLGSKQEGVSGATILTCNLLCGITMGVHGLK
jgi:hypothetical protein